MADGTRLHADVSTSNQISFIRWNWHWGRHLFFQSSMHSHRSEFLLEGIGKADVATGAIPVAKYTSKAAAITAMVAATPSTIL